MSRLCENLPGQMQTPVSRPNIFFFTDDLNLILLTPPTADTDSGVRRDSSTGKICPRQTLSFFAFESKNTFTLVFAIALDKAKNPLKHFLMGSWEKIIINIYLALNLTTSTAGGVLIDPTNEGRGAGGKHVPS